MNANAKRSPVLPLAMAALTAAALLFVHRLEPWGDAFDYLLMAKSVLAGDWGAVLSWRYPPLFPSWLGLVAWVSTGRDALGAELLAPSSRLIYLLKASGLLLHVLTVLMVGWWAGRVGLGRVAAFGLALWFAIDQHVAVVASLIGAEGLLMLFFWAGLASVESKSARETPRRTMVLLVTLLFAAAPLTRSVGAALPCGLAGWLVIDLIRTRSWMRVRNWWPAVVVPLGLFALYTASGSSDNIKFITSGSGYLALEYDTDRPVVLRIVYHAVESFPMIANLKVPKIVDETGVIARLGLPFLGPAFVSVVGLILLAGIAVTLRRRITVTHVAAAVYLVAVFMTLSPKGRYYLPLVPVFLWWSVAAWDALQSRLPARAARVVPVAAWLLLAWIAATTLLAGAKNWHTLASLSGREAWDPLRYEAAGEDDYAGLVRMAVWIRDNTEPDGIVVASKAPLVELASGRSTLYLQALYGEADPESVLSAIPGGRSVLVVQDALPAEARAGAAGRQVIEVLRDAGRLRLVAMFGEGDEAIYEWRR